jgi:imidazolonepropionase-like amidohydrolase
MEYANRIIVAVILLGITAPGTTQEAVRSAMSPIAFVDVNIVRPEKARVDHHRTVIVSGKKITAVGPVDTVQLPPEAHSIDARGAYLIAGLAEMHAHVPHQPASDEYVQDVLFLWAANGITTIRGMNGEPSHLGLRDRIDSQEILGPRLFTAGPPFIGKKIKTGEEARRLVIEQQEAGYDFIKVHMGISRAVYDAIATTSAVYEFPFAGHVTAEVGLLRALEVGQSTIDHLDSYWVALARSDADVAGIDYGLLGAPLTPFIDDAKIPALADATRVAGVWNVPTLSMAEKFVAPIDAAAADPGLKYMPYRTVKGWMSAATGFQKDLDEQSVETFLNYRKKLVKALHDAGAGLLLGADAPQILNVPGFSVHRELQLLVEAGLTPAEALTTGTVNPARFLGKQDTFGQVAEGLDADLVLTRDNPLENIGALRTPQGVMLRGTWLSRDEIRARLQLIADKNKEP